MNKFKNFCLPGIFFSLSLLLSLIHTLNRSILKLEYFLTFCLPMARPDEQFDAREINRT